MLPTRVIILGLGDATVGLILLLSTPVRTSSPAYRQVKQVAAVDVWGLALLLIGLGMLLIAACRRFIPGNLTEWPERTIAGLGAAWSTFWAVVLLETANIDQRVSFTGAALWFFFVTVPHMFLAFGREG